MSSTLQLLLVGSETGGTDLTVFASEEGPSCELYLGLAERVSVDPVAFRPKPLVGRLYNAGKPVRDLSETFRHDARTIRNWGNAVEATDTNELVRAFTGPGGGRRSRRSCSACPTAVPPASGLRTQLPRGDHREGL